MLSEVTGDDQDHLVETLEACIRRLGVMSDQRRANDPA